MKKIKNYLKLMRIKHYLKNGLIFLPLIFSGEITNVNKLLGGFIAFICFSIFASVIYIINDIKDVEKDRQHEVKRNRPIASGAVKVKEAIILAIFLVILSTSIHFMYFGIKNISFIFILAYVFINILYNMGLKHVPLIDVVILVAGFLIRVMYGGSVNNIEVSNWLYLTVMTGSFYLGFGKRRNEIIKLGNNGRKVLQYYTKEFLDKNMYMCQALSIVFYSLWCTTQDNQLLVYSVPFVLVILMKYALNIEKESFGDPVDVVYGDKWLLVLIALYGIFMFGVLYFEKITTILHL